VKYDRADTFLADYRCLSEEERARFREAVRRLNDAFARRGDRALPEWPASLRIKPIRGAPGIWELTWSFAGPDGRATFELVRVGEEPAIRWRRIGGHHIFREP
jgi:hypothetical protein